MSASPSIVYRLAEPKDLAALAQLFDAYRQFYERQPDLPGAEAFLRTNLEEQRSVIFLALEPASEPGASASCLGFAQLYPTLSSLSMRRIWTLNDLFVAPEARGRGVGQGLLKVAAEHARSTGAKGVQLSTAADNDKAQRLYEKSGYVRDTEFFHYFLNLEG
jgi:ribosomal protein S18 acetylase RimI-like enzyme